MTDINVELINNSPIIEVQITGGIQGPTGATGATGAKGDTGAAGAKGDKGEPGTVTIPFVVGGATHYMTIDATGHMTMVGDARPWRDEVADALNLQQSGAGVSINNAEATVDFAYNATFNATFSNADATFCNIQLNHDKDLTCGIYPHIHWFQAKNYSPNFLLEYRWQVNGGIKTTSWTKLKCNTLAFPYVSGTLDQISYANPIMPPAGSTISDVIQFRIYRDTGNASGQFTGTCPYNTGGNASTAILFFDCHFQINSLGSTDEYLK